MKFLTKCIFIKFLNYREIIVKLKIKRRKAFFFNWFRYYKIIIKGFLFIRLDCNKISSLDRSLDDYMIRYLCMVNEKAAQRKIYKTIKNRI